MATKMKTKRRQIEKKILNFKLKVVRTNSFKLKSSTRLQYTSLGSNLGLSLLGKWRTITKRKTNLGKIKTHKILRDNCVSAQKA